MTYIASFRNSLPFALALFVLACATDPYQTVAVGDTRAEVIARLGAPGTIDKDVSPVRKTMITSNLKKLDNHGARYFSIWKPEEDLVIVIGFDKQDRVAVKHRFFFTKGT